MNLSETKEEHRHLPWNGAQVSRQHAGCVCCVCALPCCALAPPVLSLTTPTAFETGNAVTTCPYSARSWPPALIAGTDPTRVSRQPPASPPLSMRGRTAQHSQHSEERELLLNNPFPSYAETSCWESKGKYLGCNQNPVRGNPSPQCCQQRSQLCLAISLPSFCTSRD